MKLIFDVTVMSKTRKTKSSLALLFLRRELKAFSPFVKGDSGGFRFPHSVERMYSRIGFPIGVGNDSKI
jgi:hypothetical protein